MKFTNVEHVDVSNRLCLCGFSVEAQKKVFIKGELKENFLSANLNKRLIQEESELLFRMANIENVSKFLLFSYHNGNPLLVTEFIDGYKSNEVQVNIDIVTYWIKAISYALDNIHKHEIFHGDIKPDNILVDKFSNEPCLIDFETSCVHIDSNILMGCPIYMSPERITRGIFSAKSDQYSFALVCYEWIQKTFGTCNDFEELPTKIKNVFLKALNSKPEKRFASVSEFANILCGLLLA